MSEQPRLVVETVNGKEMISVEFFPNHLRSVKNYLHPRVYYPISEEEAKLSLDVLARAYKLAKYGQHAKGEQGASRDLAKYLGHLAGIIKTSHQKGERLNAKALWKKITGKEWEGAEYNDGKD
jgi:hypothetical protein